jgi:hypothetical protein
MAEVLHGTAALVTGASKRDRRSDRDGAGRPRHVAVNEMLIRPTEQER